MKQLKASILWINLLLVCLIQQKMNMLSTEALVKISKDMARVLDRLTAPRAPSDSVRKYGVEEFHGTSMEESDKA